MNDGAIVEHSPLGAALQRLLSIDLRGADAWILQIVAVALGILLIRWLQRRVLRKLKVKAAATPTFWDDSLLAAADRALNALVWIVGIAVAAHIIGSRLAGIGIFGADSWVIQIFVVIFTTLLINWLQKRVLKKLKAKAATTRTPWDLAFLEAASRPLTVLIWIVGIAFAAEIAGNHTDGVGIFAAVEPLRAVGVVATIAWFLARFVHRAEDHILRARVEKGEPFDRTTADAIAKLLRISILITAFLVILQTLGYSLSGLLAFGGIGGLVAGLAAKDLLANFFGGLMIYLDRPFAVGDWVRSPDREIEGTVEHIGWRLTRIRTFDKRPLYLPNAIFTQIALENPSRMTNRRIYETIGIRYDDADKMAAIIAAVKKMLREHPDIDPARTLIVNFNKFAPSSLDFFVYTFTRTCDWVRFHEVKQEVMLRIVDIIAQHGAQCAFPTSTIHLAGADEAAPLAPAPES